VYFAQAICLPVNIEFLLIEDKMGQLAVRLTDSNTRLRLDDRATITLNGTNFDQFDASDSTYMASVSMASGFYMLNISYLYYKSRSLTVDLSAGGVIVREESGSVVVTTISATKDIIEVEMTRYAFSGRVTDEGGALVEADIDLMDIDYLHDPDVVSHQHETTDDNGDFYFDSNVPEGVTAVVVRVRKEGHFPVDIRIGISPGRNYVLKIKLHSAANALVIISAGHGINTDNRNNSGDWTVALNPFHQRPLMRISNATQAPASVAKVIGHDPDYYVEDEGTAWFAGEALQLLAPSCPNLGTTRDLSRTPAQMRNDVGTPPVPAPNVIGQPTPGDWRCSTLWYVAQRFTGGGDFEYQQAQHRIHRNHNDPEYSFGPNYAMGTGNTHTQLAADYSTYLTQTNQALQPVLVDFHTNAGGAQDTRLHYRRNRTGGTTTNKPNDERFARTIALNIKELFDSAVGTNFHARTTRVRDFGARSNVYEALCPTVIIETAYHDNRNDLARIMDANFQRSMALGVFRGVRDYYFPRLRGRLLDSSNTPQSNMVVYFTKPAVPVSTAPRSLADIDSSTVTDTQGHFTINLERNTDYLLWVNVGGTYQALNPSLVNLAQNDPPINFGTANSVNVQNPQDYIM
jgi:hypothetical protein